MDLPIGSNGEFLDCLNYILMLLLPCWFDRLKKQIAVFSDKTVYHNITVTGSGRVNAGSFFSVYFCFQCGFVAWGAN